ncbi:MAG: hypothetical protein JW818_07525 [Pirellulales bacterium]|nr:hypothetical protein [Pirellulales bacterium]
MLLKRLTVVLLMVILLYAAGVAQAGGGPENVFLVVNPKSPTSQRIANHYVAFRKIPAGNVFELPWDPDVGETDVKTFREKILRPILEEINRRRLAGQIDYVVYSSDYPWGISLKLDIDAYLKRLPEARQKDKNAWPKVLTRVGSPTGLTYLWQATMTGQPVYVQLTSNRYMRTMSKDHQQQQPTIGFNGRLRFGPDGKTDAAEGRQYLLSVMLGATVGKDRRGNTPEEVLAYLEKGVGADGTSPRGTVYYAKTADVRSKTRADLFPTAVAELKKLGVNAEIIKDVAPKQTTNVCGVTMGTAAFNWVSFHSRLLPGAIGDNLTSYGGVMKANSSQTTLAEYLRYGAAGASGPVTEPYAFPPNPKFPNAMLHVHYARGCSLAEAYYQAVHGPYQLLIVGEPLCQPWAKIPKVSVTGAKPGETVKGLLTLTPSATIPGGGQVDHYELFVNGVRLGKVDPGVPFSLDTAKLIDGYHEFRVVAVGPAPIHTQGRAILPLKTANHGRTIMARYSPPGGVRLGGHLDVTAKSPGASQIDVYHRRLHLGTIRGESGQLAINPDRLGQGPVQLDVIAVHGAGLGGRVRAEPLSFEVGPAKP